MLIDLLSDLISDSAIPIVMIITIVIIFDKKLKFRQYLTVFIVTQMCVMFEHILLRYTNENNLRSFLIFYFASFLESAEVFWVFSYIFKEEILSRLYIIYVLYLQVINGIVGYICGLSDELAYALNAHIIYRKPAPIIPICIICLLHIAVGSLVALPVRKYTLNRKRFETDTYKWIVVVFLCLLVVMGGIRHGYYNVLAKKESSENVTLVVIITSITFLIIFIVNNAIVYFVNMMELKRMQREQKETEKWIYGIAKQYESINIENKEMKNILENKMENMDAQSISHRALRNNISLTGNIMLDTLFAYYSQMAKEKDIVFEIQSELANGDRIKCDNYYLSAGTEIVDEISDNEAGNVNQNKSENVSKGENGNPDSTTYRNQDENPDENSRRNSDRNMGRNKSRKLAADEAAKIMNKIDMVTISDRVLSAYFDKAENEKGYVFVNLKLGGGKLMLDYEMNKELGIDRLSFGVCRKYKKLRAVRRIVRMKGGVVSCETKEGRQRISVMFVGKNYVR